MPEPPKELPAFPNEAAFQQKLKERRQRVEELEVEQKPSLGWAIAISVVTFFLFLPFPIESIFVIPKFKVIYADMLGAGETLPEFTMLILSVSDMLNNNAFILLPVYLLFSLACAGFIGFNRFFLSRKISTIITGLFIPFLFLGLIVGPVIAMFLPLIKMMDKLGQ